MNLLTLLFSIALTACGQNNSASQATSAVASEEKAQERLQVKLGSTYEDGWNLRTVQTSTQELGKTKLFRVTLLSGNNYRFLATADENAQDIALSVVDANGKPLTSPDSGGVEADLTVKAQSSQSVFLAAAVESMNGKASKSGVAVGVMYK